ncbi:MAG: glycoside hydrolase family 32 protein [Selenomonadaceae bacterium]|nr:glycoside hydrolase family 32 protein [Selenomonadaceae bacterium]
MAEQILELKAFSQVTDARWYPRYHIAPPFGWCNDPNGMCYYKGQYHFFYQHYPYEPRWGPMHWGHVVSDDLAYWKHLPIALKPEEAYEKGGGCFSGSAIEKDGELWLMYTGHLQASPEEAEAVGFPHIEFQCLAHSEDGIHFKKSEKNPVIEDIENNEVSINDIRDPKVWEHNGKYYAVLGSRTPDMAHGQILLFESKDLTKSWKFKAISARSDGNLGGMWECPNFAEIDGQDVLVFSPMDLNTDDGTFYHDKAAGVLIGKLNYKTGIFKHGDFQYLDRGFDFYAPQVMQTPDGRTIMIGWLDMWNVEMHETQDGWAGQMTIPRELHIRNGKIFSTPAKELEKLRKWKPITFGNVVIDEPTTFDGVAGEACELVMTIDAARSKKFSIALRASDIEQTVLTYNANGKFTFDRTNSGLTIHEAANVREIPVEPQEKLKLHIFIDRSSVEVFINDGAEVISARIYPKRTSQKIIFTPEDELLVIDSLEYYKLDFGLPHPHIKETPVDLKAQFPFLK